MKSRSDWLATGIWGTAKPTHKLPRKRWTNIIREPKNLVWCLTKSRRLRTLFALLLGILDKAILTLGDNGASICPRDDLHTSNLGGEIMDLIDGPNGICADRLRAAAQPGRKGGANGQQSCHGNFARVYEPDR